MRIERIDIDGFGRIANQSFELPPGLTVFRGENEAGKSTLLNGVRALLFGFESTRNGRVWYPAVAGGRRGGSLVLVDHDGGRWTVTRHGESGGTGTLLVQAPTGNQGGTETLDRLLRGADKDLFRSIFAFGLSELSDVSSLSAEGIRGRIYGAATGLGGASAVDLEADLRERLEDLFKPTGHKPALNALFGRMDELRDRIAALSRAPEEYATAHRQRAEATATADRLRAEAETLRARIIRLEHSRRAAPLFAELADVEGRLDATDPALDLLPADAAVAGQARAAALEAAMTRLGDVDRSLADCEADLEAVVVDEAVLAAAVDLRALEADRAALAGDETRRVDALGAAARHAATVGDQLARTRMSSDEALLGLDDSIPALDALGSLEAALEEANRALAESERRRALLRDQAATRAARQSPDAGAMDLDGAFAALRAVAARRARRDIAWVSALALVAGGLAAAAVPLGLLLGSPLAGLVVGAVLAAGAFVVTRLGSRDGALDAELLARAGLPTSPTEEDVERRREELALERLRCEQAAAADRADAELRGRLAAAETDVADATARRDEATERWRHWLAGAGLQPDTNPPIARQVLAAAGTARRAAEDRREQLAIVEDIVRRASAFEARATTLLDALNVAPGATIVGRLQSAIALLETATRADERRRGIVAQRSKLGGQQKALAAEVETARRALGEHLAAVQVPDLPSLRARAAAAADRRDVANRVRALHRELVAVAGSEPVAHELRAASATLDLVTVETEHAEATARLAEIEEEERSVHARVGELNAEIRRLESSADLGAARQELAILEGQAHALARRWATTALAGRLLAETRRRYERERQPDVVRAAQAYFQRITNGRYERIAAPPGDASIRVETDSGEQLLPSELSRGTVEQLYLALRFGLIEEFARHAEPLPVVMDDILVNFDEGRTERAAAAIAQLASSHQVLFFTCRAGTAAALDPSGERTRMLG